MINLKNFIKVNKNIITENLSILKTKNLELILKKNFKIHNRFFAKMCFYKMKLGTDDYINFLINLKIFYLFFIFYIYKNLINIFFNSKFYINKKFKLIYYYKKTYKNKNINIFIKKYVIKLIKKTQTLKKKKLYIKKKKFFLLKKSQIKISPFLNTGLALLIADLEQYINLPIFFNIEQLKYIAHQTIAYCLKSFFYNQFRWISFFVKISIKTLFHSVYYFGLSRDIKLITTIYKQCFDTTHFSLSNRLYHACAKMLCFIWPFYCINCGGVGILFVMSGKFSRHLLTQARTHRLRLGKTSFGMVKNNIIFGYEQTESETGCYGLNLFYTSKCKVFWVYK